MCRVLGYTIKIRLRNRCVSYIQVVQIVIKIRLRNRRVSYNIQVFALDVPNFGMLFYESFRVVMSVYARL